MPNGKKQKNKSGNGGGRPKRSSKGGQVFDFRNFNNRRRFLFSTQVVLTESPNTPGAGATVALSNFPDSTLAMIPALRTLINAFSASRLVNVKAFFDQRGNNAANYRTSAFLLPTGPSSVDIAQITALAPVAGQGVSQISAMRVHNLRVGPEFAAGRFADTSSVATTLVLYGQGYGGQNSDPAISTATVRLEFTYEVQGPPVDFSPASGYEVLPSDQDQDPRNKEGPTV